MIVWRPAFVRGLRSFLQGCAAALIAFATWLGAQSAFEWVAFSQQASKLAIALGLALTYGLISFVQNVIEDTWGGAKTRALKG